ncbi:aspartate kinase [Xanthomonas fragariae]|uniref:Aspartate kinase n=1 Tax=Xanthomonas fragariae TaxID=48664 RepID=A0A1Y6H7M9_9XANT|nr:hypothetical protein BER92_16620 [Xanthomonas fragariae]ENZ96959.1 aspartate kinase [Xanthomonas fragariae LMG 25863]AOD19438.1 hypothetical protein BER93_16675 [Xanthomonas fragariae]SMQ93732.1 aspartate kinase [Xanthomonas fragariae]SMQ97842.1 hypothetical protein PD885_00574 [Xanthomonas fragariae]
MIKHKKIFKDFFTFRPGKGLRLMDALNIGAVAGLPIAFTSFFSANRLLPVTLEARAAMEANLFFVAWATALLAAFVWPRRAMGSWQLYLGVRLPAGQWTLAGVDLVCPELGVCLDIGACSIEKCTAARVCATCVCRCRRARAGQRTDAGKCMSVLLLLAPNLSGLAAFCLAMDKHQRQVHARMLGATRSRQLRAQGWGIG